MPGPAAVWLPFFMGLKMKRADYWELEGSAIRCRLCPRFCLIAEGQSGFCGVRAHYNAELEALTYGKIVSWACDPIEKKPLYHFYPGHKTFSIGGVGCNLRCRHCQNWQISCAEAKQTLDSLRDLSPEAAVRSALDNGCQSLVWTYNEPSIWFEYIRDTAPLAQAAGLKTVLVTAGMICSEPLAELLPDIDAYRLDVKGFSGDFYRWLTGVDCLEQVLDNGVTAFKAGCHVEIVTNLIPGHNDDEQQLRSLARWIALELSPRTAWHLTAYYPNHQLDVAATGLASLERGLEIAREEGLRHVYIGNVPGHPSQHSYCAACEKIVIRRAGFGTLENLLEGGCCPQCREPLGAYRG